MLNTSITLVQNVWSLFYYEIMTKLLLTSCISLPLLLFAFSQLIFYVLINVSLLLLPILSHALQSSWNIFLFSANGYSTMASIFRTNLCVNSLNTSGIFTRKGLYYPVWGASPGDLLPSSFQTVQDYMAPPCDALVLQGRLAPSLALESDS